MNVRTDRFPLMDALRAIAALSVVAYHAAYFALLGRLDPPPGTEYFHRLDVGVTIFFLISGFLLYRPFVRARMRGEPAPATGAYAWRRFLRIAPAYWVALTVVAIWLGLSEVFTVSGVPRFYGFAQIYNYRTALQGIGQAWTLCVEVTFYAFIPVWAAIIRRLPGRDGNRVVVTELAALALLFAASTAYKLWALRHTTPSSLRSGPYLMPLPNFLDQFALGMALAVVSVRWEGRERLPRPVELVRRFPTLPWLVAGVAFWAASTQIGYRAVLFQHISGRSFVERHELYSVVALGMILPAVFAAPGRGLAGRVLASRVLAYVGLVSYAVYLYHFAVVKQLQEWLAGSLPSLYGPRFAILFVLAGLGAVAVATVSYYLVERPALRLKRLVPGRPTEAARGEAIVEPAPVAPARATSLDRS